MNMVEVTDEMSLEEQSQRLFRISIKNAGQLKAWLEKTGRTWLVFNAMELVDSLPFPDGLDTLIQIIACYRDHRRTLPSGRTEKQTDEMLGEEIDVPVMKDELLEVAELDRAIRYLVGQITERDETWSLDNPAM